MSILVTGGAGFIGSHVCGKLLARNENVICVDNFNDYYDPIKKDGNIKGFLKNPNFKLYKGDIRNFDKLDGVFKENKIGKVVHLAAMVGVRYSIENPSIYSDVNVKGTKNLLKLGVEHKIKNFVFGSSSSIYGISKKIPFNENDGGIQISPYANTKKEGEKLCKEYNKKYGLNVTCLRFFTVYGPNGRPDMAPYKFTKLIDEGKAIPVYGDGKTKRDYTYITDIVDGIIAALDKNFAFEIINLGDSNPIELRYFISLIEKNLGKKAKIKQEPMQPGDVPITFADISKAKKLLNYNPKVKIEEGIRMFVGWYKNAND
ncbi:GDP-mannose 4,6-dehydratase [Candidatus Woesearchaeota archaeon]|nr:GDP-mannose 4,6-dehydratase [Candidatus Woesearchaeota archaeon]